MSKPKQTPGAETRLGGQSPVARVWMPQFLAALAETSNVTRAAKIAGVSTSAVYEARRKRREFARHWQAALCEGYDNLEMELLGRLREGELKPPPGAKRAARSYDNAVALRLLLSHREAVTRERASQTNVDASEIRASIDRKVAALRAQVLAESEARDDHDDTL
ncbi:hypothetical protein [Altericroceibacterium xinjiangense]|uniref:hypothetical protein n=1 Tax=Altericroceibacterium xinjiangense TaxID=762261 RepID=UPI000F7E4469|nr:hypothetical protein [Altericroceibacterium xinjiangense]